MPDLLTEESYPLRAEWTDDCQGKKDYDGPILSLSTRYWPAGGGFGFIVTNQNGRVDINHNPVPHMKPSASSSLQLDYGEDDYLDLITKEFEGDTEADVKAQVETWAQEQMDRVVAMLRREFAS